MDRVTLLNRWQRAAYDEVASHWVESPNIPKTCNARISRGALAGKQCPRKAGQGTQYPGYGNCVAHGGAKRQGRAVSGWYMAHRFAEELDVSPWEALLMVIRITAGRLRYIESVLGTAVSDDEIEGKSGPDGSPLGVGEDGQLLGSRNLTWWVEKSEVERTNLAKFSKAAIDAGVAQLLIEKELRAGDELASSYVRSLKAMEEAGMPEDMLEIARTALRGELQLALEGGQIT